MFNEISQVCFEEGMCPDCGGQLDTEWDNLGYEQPNGPIHEEIIKIFCRDCRTEY